VPREGRKLIRAALGAALLGAAVIPGGTIAGTARAEREAPGARTLQAPKGRVVEDSLWSQALGIRKRMLVWLPPSYATHPDRRYPVAYFLHGAWGDETSWTRLGKLDGSLDSLVAAGVPEMIVVMPDGDDGWYSTWNWLGDYAACRRDRPQDAEPADRYCVPWPHYDDYIARDLVGHVDRTYRTRAERRHRGIAGLSMGGYGAIALALSYPDVFAAAASHSGALAPMAHGTAGDTLDYQSSLDSLRRRFGPRLWPVLEQVFGKDTTGWLSRDPARKAERLARNGVTQWPALFVDCGTEDFLLGQNRFFRRRAAALGIPLRYAEWPGNHTWTYWRRHGPESAAWIADKVSMP
jgi:S-formylglutathione hydrolase FrmB